MITTAEIKSLREFTGLSIMECKKALEEANGDRDRALAILKTSGASISAKKSGRILGAGTVASYIHASSAVGSMVELLCETDFVARNPEFKEIAHDIAMHIAAMNPESLEELLQQSYIKDSERTIENLVNGATQKFGERTEVGRFTRYSIK
jgi:elongation factor Ts